MSLSVIVGFIKPPKLSPSMPRAPPLAVIPKILELTPYPTLPPEPIIPYLPPLPTVIL